MKCEFMQEVTILQAHCVEIIFFFANKKKNYLLGIHNFNELDLAIRIQANFTFFQMVLFPFRIILRVYRGGGVGGGIDFSIERP